MISRVVLTALFALFLSGPAAARIELSTTAYLFVADGGSDSNNCSILARCATITAAFRASQDTYSLTSMGKIVIYVCGTQTQTFYADGQHVGQTYVAQVTVKSGPHAGEPVLTGFPGQECAAPALIDTRSINYHAVDGYERAWFTISGFRLKAGASAIFAQWHSRIDFSAIDFEEANRHLEATKGGYLFSAGNYRIIKGARSHLAASNFGTVFISEVQGTIVDFVQFTDGFAYAIDNGNVLSHTSSWPNRAAVNGGPKWFATNGGLIAGQSDPDYYPGLTYGTPPFNVLGSTGGLYR